MMVVDAAAVADLADLDTADRVAELRRRLAAMPGGGPPASARSTAPAAPRPPAPAAPPRSSVPPAAPVHPEGPGDVAPVLAGPDPVASAPTGVAASAPVTRPPAAPAAAVPGVAVPESVAHLVPGGVLPAGRVTAVSGSATLRVGLLAAATASGARCAVVGWPELGVAAVAEQGGRLDCLALVPDPGPDPAAVVSVLLDGLDLVLLGPAVAAVAPSRARVLGGRVRAAGAVLLVGPGWPGAELTLAGRHCRYGGLGAGTGRLASVSTVVRCSGRAAPARTAEWVAAG
ncbi:hypothetical protein M3B38_04440 [Dietzia cinnamea]|uniref:hypothetical protein n=1 Tax=Dietzia cinnamea TaxID=321318 RepID=UPI00223B094E|nr:hypothetical protein [Dietzia cinnamea]MCT1711231.1 hypothetical protein [Dietzia cinnamea]MCT2263627.1 hypothetical protein [Dietzia cinnamea]